MLGETQVMGTVDDIQKQFARRTLVLKGIGNLATLSTSTAWTLPADFFRLYDIKLFDSSNEELQMDNTTWSLGHRVDNGILHIFSTSSTAITGIPGDISVIWIYYYKLPATISALTTALTVPEDFSDAILAGTLESFYARVPTLPASEKVLVPNMTAARYWRDIYESKVREAMRTTEDDGLPFDIKRYEYAGAFDFPGEIRNSNISVTSVTAK